MNKIAVIGVFIFLVVLMGCLKIQQPCPANQTQGVSAKASPPDSKPQSIPPVVLPTLEKRGEGEFTTKTVTAGQLVSFPNLDAVDPDGESITYLFSWPFNDKGEWLTKKSDVGEHMVNITLSDGVNKVVQRVKIIVVAPDLPPKIEAPEKVNIDEGQSLSIPVKVVDPEGKNVSVRYSGWISEFPYSVTFDDSGVHVIRIHASDGIQEVVSEVEVSVRNINRPPKILPINTVILNETDKVSLHPKAIDPDQEAVSFRFTKPLQKDGTWQTKLGDAGKYEVTVTATDGKVESNATFLIIVEALDKPPVIKGTKDLIVNEGETIRLDISAEDPEGKETKIILNGYMNAMIKDVGFTDAGVHTVRVTASDGQRTSTQSFTVTVNDVNRPPVFGPNAFS